MEMSIVLVCLILNALLSLVEMAFVSVGKGELKSLAQSGNKKAQKILELRTNPERTLSILQIGITLVGAVSAAVGGAGAEESLSPVFESWGFSENVSEVFSLVIIVLPLTYFSVVIGELVPKTIALRNPTRIILKGARWLSLFDRILSPAVSLLEWSTKKILHLFFRLPHVSSSESEEQIDLSRLTKPHRQYVLNLVHLEKKRARDLVIPWDQTIWIHFEDPLEKVLAVVAATRHTRLPVCRSDQAQGILNTKELMSCYVAGETNWNALVRPLVQVHEETPILGVLMGMQEKRSHLALVFSKQNPRLGIVTLEDILEEVVGDLFDEDDDGAIKKILGTTARLKQFSFRK